MSESVPGGVFAEMFYKEAIKNRSIYDEYKQVIKEEGISQDENRIEWEVFYFWIFILSYCFQRGFSQFGEDKIGKVLDAIHRHIYDPKEHPELSKEELKDVHNIITIRYTQYYKAIKIDLEAMRKATKGKMLYSVLVDAFLQNLIDKKIEDIEVKEYFKFTKFRVKFGLMIGYLCNDMFDWLERIKGKYEINFNS